MVSAIVEESKPPPTIRRMIPKINEPKDTSPLNTYTSRINSMPNTIMVTERVKKTPNANQDHILFMSFS
jgi:hypothetical protein